MNSFETAKDDKMAMLPFVRILSSFIVIIIIINKSRWPTTYGLSREFEDNTPTGCSVNWIGPGVRNHGIKR